MSMEHTDEAERLACRLPVQALAIGTLSQNADPAAAMDALNAHLAGREVVPDTVDGAVRAIELLHERHTPPLIEEYRASTDLDLAGLADRFEATALPTFWRGDAGSFDPDGVVVVLYAINQWAGQRELPIPEPIAAFTAFDSFVESETR